RHGVAEPFIIHEKESLVVNNGSAKGSAEIVLDEMIVAHRGKRCGIHSAIAKKFVGCPVKLIRAGTGDNVDLTATGSAHFRRVAAGLDFEFLHRIRREA